MICSKCGAQVPDNSTFCTNCGAPLAQPQYYNQQQPVYQQPQYNQYGSYTNPSLDAGPIMKQGIIAAALSELGIPGIIIGAIAKKKVANYLAQGGERNGKIKAASICSKIGFIVGIVMTAILTFSFFVGFFSSL